MPVDCFQLPKPKTLIDNDLLKPSKKSKENIFTFLRIVLNYREMSLTERNGNAAHKTDELRHPDVDVLRC